MGSGIWSMHFIAMLAIEAPLPIGYEFSTTALSLLVAIIFSSLAFLFMTRRAGTRAATAGAGLLLGLGVTSMHYIGMAAMKAPEAIQGQPDAALLSGIAAVLTSFCSLSLFAHVKATPLSSDIVKKLLAAILMGGGITLMHFIAMGSATMAAAEPFTPVATDINLVISIAIIVFFIQSVGVVTILMDETIMVKEKIIELEKQFMQTQKMEAIGTLVGGVSHDFNNMLSGIIGNLYLAKKKMEDNQAAVEKLVKAEELAEHASEMIRQLLTLARTDDIEQEVFSLTQYSEKTFKLAKVSIPRRISCISRICSDELFINGNKTQVQQLVINMTNNARDALIDVEQPEIICSLSMFEADEEFRRKYPALKTGQLARLSIIDNGKGIPESNLDTIFEPFFTTKAVGHGTGLGLSMAYGAVKSHGGEIEVESREQEGTVFHMYFPIVEPAVDSIVAV
ncbi:MHYT domain-containing protein [Mariprofundus ferrooxydans]|uniref:MHYT domain-containing protein n=1 Tax=Mariprofundus ferrooxydans TaxID=314344 RepID=UPI003B8A684B